MGTAYFRRDYLLRWFAPQILGWGQGEASVQASICSPHSSPHGKRTLQQHAPTNPEGQCGVLRCRTMSRPADELLLHSRHSRHPWRSDSATEPPWMGSRRVRQRSTPQWHSCYGALKCAVTLELRNTGNQLIKRALLADNYRALVGALACLCRTTGRRAFLPLLGSRLLPCLGLVVVPGVLRVGVRRVSGALR